MKSAIKIILGLFSIVAIGNVALAVTQPLDSIAAKVNNQIITTTELNRQVTIAKQQLKAQHLQIPAENVLSHQIIEMMIVQDLQLQLAARLGFSVTDLEVNKFLDTLAKNENTTKQKLLASTNQQGLSTEEFLIQLKNHLIISKLQKYAISPQLTVTPTEIDAAIVNAKQKNKQDIDPTTLRNQITERLLKQKFAAHLTNWQDQLRASTYVEIMLPQ